MLWELWFYYRIGAEDHMNSSVEQLVIAPRGGISPFFDWSLS